MSQVVDLMTEFVRHYRLVVAEPSLYEVLLEKGREMSIEPLTVSEARYVAKLARSAVGGIRAFRQRECYLNAQKLRLSEYWRGGRRVCYCEGYVAWEGGPLPISHAWITIGGKVVDVTLRALAKKKPHSYFGVVIPPRLLMDHMMLTETYGPVIEGPLQRRVFPEFHQKER